MKSLADMLGRTLRDTGSAPALAPVWNRAVGELIARHTRPIRWDGSALVICCDAESWKAALEPERPALLKRLRELLGETKPPGATSMGSETALSSIVLEITPR
ncbi:MAG: DUF721 domain-containing protein [Archangium sp.]|nr:DUF721 domain-containing protein [Archangium sp.]